MNYRNIITIEADKRGGKPCIRGLRMTVYDVLDYLASGMTPEHLLGAACERLVNSWNGLAMFRILLVGELRKG